MKKTLFTAILALFALCSLNVEARTVLKYQTLVTGNDGNPMISAPVSFNIVIREGSATGDVVISETGNPTTSEAGVAYLKIGEQSLYTTLDDLDWAGNTYFLDMSVDRGTGMQSLGCTQIMSVPKAIYASTAGALVLESPSGKHFKVTIDDNGQVSTQLIAE